MIRIKRAHNLEPEQAKNKIGELTRELGEALELEMQDRGDHYTFSRTGVKGKIAVDETDVRIEVKKSWFVPKSDDWIREQIEKKLDTYLG